MLFTYLLGCLFVGLASVSNIYRAFDFTVYRHFFSIHLGEYDYFTLSGSKHKSSVYCLFRQQFIRVWCWSSDHQKICPNCCIINQRVSTLSVVNSWSVKHQINFANSYNVWNIGYGSNQISKLAYAQSSNAFIYPNYDPSNENHNIGVIVLDSYLPSGMSCFYSLIRGMIRDGASSADATPSHIAWY